MVLYCMCLLYFMYTMLLIMYQNISYTLVPWYKSDYKPKGTGCSVRVKQGAIKGLRIYKLRYQGTCVKLFYTVLLLFLLDLSFAPSF